MSEAYVVSSRCKACGEFHFLLSDQCPPRFRVWEKGDDSNPCDVYADRAGTAAAKFVKREDQHRDAPFAYTNWGEDLFVCVRGDGLPAETYRVTGEMVAEYWAEKVRVDAESPTEAPD